VSCGVQYASAWPRVSCAATGLGGQRPIRAWRCLALLLQQRRTAGAGASWGDIEGAGYAMLVGSAHQRFCRGHKLSHVSHNQRLFPADKLMHRLSRVPWWLETSQSAGREILAVVPFLVGRRGPCMGALLGLGRLCLGLGYVNRAQVAAIFRRVLAERAQRARVYRHLDV